MDHEIDAQRAPAAGAGKSTHRASARKPEPTPSDDDLLTCFLGGDEAAFRAIIDRYDRFVRYTIFRYTKDRCLSDPFWLDTVAADTWLGFVQAVRRDNASRPRTMANYLVTIAQRQSVSALRASVRQKRQEPGASLDAATRDPVSTEDPPEAVAGIVEQLEELHRCVAELPADERALFTQLDAIVSRRWVDAAAGLRTTESTVRSKWKRVLDKLRETLA